MVFDKLFGLSLQAAKRKFPDLVYEPIEVGQVACEWVRPQKTTSHHCGFYIHGGGFCYGSLTSHRKLVSEIVQRTGLSVLHLNYRLAPEHSFPAALEDCCQVYQQIFSSRLPREKVSIMGDSAGGNLALATMLRLKASDMRLPDMGVFLSPSTNLARISASMINNQKTEVMLSKDVVRWFGKNYRGKCSPEDPQISPLLGDLAGFPPLLVHVSQAEILLDDARDLAAAALEYGVDLRLREWPEVPHVWHFFSKYLPEARDALDDIGTFVKKQLDSD